MYSEELTLSEITEIVEENPALLELILFNDVKFRPKQQELILKSLSTPNQNALITADMGVGKTYISIGLAQSLRLVYPGKKICFIALKNKLNEYAEVLEKHLGTSVLTVTGEQPLVNKFKKEYKNYDVIVTSVSAWVHNLDFNIFMLQKVKDFCAAIYDESEALESDGYAIFSKFSKYVPHTFLTNATPISTDLLQTYNNLSPIKAFTGSIDQFRNKYALQKKNIRVQGSKEVANIQKLKEDFRDYIVNFNREEMNIEININPFFIHATPTKDQKRWIYEGMPILTALYSPTTDEDLEKYSIKPSFQNGAVSAAMILYNVLKEITNQRRKENFGNKIIYVQNYKSKLILKRMIERVFGYKVFILDGQETKKATDQLKVSEEFNNTKNAIILTNIVRGSNLGSADQIITYGLPPSSNLKQFLYRAIRTLEDKTVDLIMIYYPEYQQNTLVDTYISLQNESVLLDRNDKLAKAVKSELYNCGINNPEITRTLNNVTKMSKNASEVSINKEKNEYKGKRLNRISLNV